MTKHMRIKELLGNCINDLSWHADLEAVETDPAPKDMTAHVNGLCIRRIEEALRLLNDEVAA